MYVALAVRLETRMITADDRLVAALGAFQGLSPHVEHVQAFTR
jgi:predicted nucleic acid-binding protein